MIEILFIFFLSIILTICLSMLNYWIFWYRLKKLYHSRYLFPIEILYNNTSLKLDIKNDQFKHEIDKHHCNCNRITYYCNNKIIGYMLIVNSHGYDHRFLYMNSEYDTSDFFKIIKMARKTWKKNQNQEWNIKTQKETIFK